MKRIIIASAMSLFLVSLSAVAFADTLVMRDGTRLQGTVVSIVARTITFRSNDGIARKYPANQIESLQFFSTDRTNGRGNGYGRNNNDNAPLNNGNGYATLEAAAGTEIMVRTVEVIDSRTAGVDQVFATLVEHDVTDASGRVLVPEGSSAQLVIRQMSAGNTTGSPEMTVDLQSITVGGRRYQISTTDLSRNSETGIGTNKRTAEAVGGGTVLGTIIGAIAGGGKGAA